MSRKHGPEKGNKPSGAFSKRQARSQKRSKAAKQARKKNRRK